MLHQGRVGAAEIDHPQAIQELLRGVGVVEVVAKGGDIHAVKRRGKGHNLECGAGTMYSWSSPLCGLFFVNTMYGCSDSGLDPIDHRQAIDIRKVLHVVGYESQIMDQR